MSFPRTLTALLQARRPLGRPPVRCAPSPHRMRGARRPPNRAGTNTEHGMPIDGDLSHLLVSSMIAMPGSPKSPDQRRTGPGKSPTAKLVPGKGNPVRELVHGERESFTREYRRQPSGPAVVSEGEVSATVGLVG